MMMMSESDQQTPSTAAAEANPAARVAGAELLRQLSTHKLDKFYQSDETLHNYVTSKRKSAAPIVKRFSDNHHDRQHHRPTVAQSSKSERPRLLRQSTTNSESVAVGTGSGQISSGAAAAPATQSRRRQLADTKDHRYWRSCDVNHPEAVALAGTHRIARSPRSSAATKTRSISGSIGRPDGSLADAGGVTPSSARPSHLDLLSASSYNSLTAVNAGLRSSPSPSGRRTNGHQENESLVASIGRLAELDGLTGSSELIRYTKAGDGQSGDEDRVVLPSLARIRSASQASDLKHSQPLAHRMANAAGSTTKKVLHKESKTAKQDGNKKTKKKKRTSSARSAPGAVAMTAIAVAVVTGSDRSADPSKESSTASNPRRRARGIVILTSVFLLFTCLFLVGITLRLAPLIDDLGKIDSQSFVFVHLIYFL